MADEPHRDFVDDRAPHERERRQSRVVVASWVGTVALALTSGMAVVAPSTFSGPSTVVSVAMFVVGCAAFLVAFARGVSRSQHEQVSVAGLFLLMGGSVPAGVRRQLLASLLAQVVVGLAAAGLRPFTTQAAGILAPVYGLGMCGLWAGRHGNFAPRYPG